MDDDFDSDELIDPPEPAHVADDRVRVLNGLSDAEFLAVSDAALGRQPQLPEGASSEMRALIDLVKATGFAGLRAKSAVSETPAERVPTDFGRLSDEDFSRVSIALRDGVDLPESDALAPLVSDQRAAREAWEAGDGR